MKRNTLLQKSIETLESYLNRLKKYNQQIHICAERNSYSKTLQVAKTFLKHRKEDLDRILSEEGILFRTNRSIQAEGSFGDLKQDMQFRRYLSKGNANVLAESTLLAMARSINKLHNKIQNGRTGTHLFSIKSA